MTRQKFKNCLIQAMEAKDQWMPNNDIETFLDLNYDEDSSIAEWEFSDFFWFVDSICEEGFWKAVKSNDLHTPEEYEDED